MNTFVMHYQDALSTHRYVVVVVVGFCFLFLFFVFVFVFVFFSYFTYFKPFTLT